MIGTTVWSVPGGDAGDRQQVVLLDAGTGKRISSFPMPSGARGGPAVPAGRAVVIGGGSGAPTYTPAGKALVDRGVDLSWLVQPIAGRLYRVPESGLITELDPTTMTTVDTIAAPPHHGDWNWALAGDGKGHLWYRPDYTHLYQVDIVSKKVSLILTLPWEEAPTGIWYAFDSLWVSNFDADTVWRVDVSG